MTLNLPGGAIPNAAIDQNLRAVSQAFPLGPQHLQNFVLKLAAEADVSLAFGVASVTWSGSSGEATVTHGLGATPTIVLTTAKSGAFQVNTTASTYTETTFKAFVYRTDGAEPEGSIEVAWAAIG